MLTKERTAMWKIEDAVNNVTNRVMIPNDGTITISKPDTVRVNAYINDSDAAIQQLNVKAGDLVYFKLTNYKKGETPIGFEYEGNNYVIMLPGKEPTAPKTTVITEDGAPLAIISENQAVENSNNTKEEDMTPQDTINLFANPGMGGGAGAIGGGLGAGLVGGLLGTALFGRNGLNGLDGGGAAVSVNNDMAIMQTLGDIKAAVPLAESQVQLALAGAQMDINSSIQSANASTIGAVSALSSSLMSNLNMQTQMNQKGFADNAATTVAQGTANLLATKDAATQALQSSWLLNQAITADGDKTRSLIQSIDKTNDSRTITALANEVSELRNEGRLATATGNITISNNNTANAVAQQQQSQQQQQQLTTLLAHVNALYAQNQHIQQGVLNIGSGTVSGNSQTAANTRVS